MAALNPAAPAHPAPQPSAAAALRTKIDSALAIYAQPIFSRRWVVGLFVLLAVSAAPASLVFSVCALLGAGATMFGLKLVRDYTPYSYNALLCGAALGSLYALTPQSAGFAFALGALSVVITAALAALASSFSYLPVAALPYTLCIWIVLSLAPYLSASLPLAAYSGDPLAEHMPHLAALWLQSLGSLVLVPKVLAGAALFLALLVHSRIASIVGAAALSGSLVLLQLAPSEPVDALVHAVCANSVLAALSLAGVWLVPSRATTVVALGTSLLAALLTLGSATPLYYLGLWPGFLPAALALGIMLSALRQRSDQRVPQLAETVAENPEQLLLDHLARPQAAALWLTPPFHGSWICTQGANGPFTHRGALAHAYDFEIADAATGALCRDHGDQPQDYYCFAQPVLASADGTVISIENTQANNAIGDIDGQQPWGNYVIVQHAPNVFSLVAHLSPGTVTVYPGQYVQRGAVLAYCGSSGRSPRPHLHFQLQSGPALGAATIPCELHDVLVRTGDRLRYAPRHEVAQGETVRALCPDYALAALFDLPLGATLSYRQDDKIERLVCDLDRWGRTQLRSLDFDAQLVFTRSYSCLRCCELRGSTRSVLRLFRLALAVVPFERDANLRFGSKLPRRWVAGFGRELLWDIAAALHAPAALAVESRMELDAEGLVIVSESAERSANGQPLLCARARFAIAGAQTHGPLLSAAVGPSSIEVTTQLQGARTLRAELVVEGSNTRSATSQEASRKRNAEAQGLALGLGEWS